ncbi:MAG: SDR family oxidoreductase [Labilithrix sp.]|nr:SDR family oxidoreductase [Labilithrix sp.]MCW5835680.1 SDR family oxidoreductase [Labilithrix sp.]
MASIFRKGLFDGHVAIVTGGGSGIGLATARSLGELGAKVAICGRSADKLAAAEAALRDRVPGVELFSAPCDIREHEQIGAFVDAVGEKLGRATILVNNAGGQFPTAAETLSPRGWEAVVRNNLNGTFFMTQAVAIKHMIPSRRGRVVNVIANIARGFPGMVHTGAARAGVENMTRTLAVEWAQHNIQLNAVAPGVIRTTGTDQYPPELVEASRKKTPMKRLGTAGEVAELIVYLASDAAFFVTGECWYIDGGAHLWGDNWVIPDDEPPPPPAIVAELGK